MGRIEPKTARVVAEYEGEPSYFDSKEFKSLCLAIAGLVRMAQRQKVDCTYRYLRERLSGNTWLYEAVKVCLNDGFIQQKGSVRRSLFFPGGNQIKPDPSNGYNRKNNYFQGAVKTLSPDY